jgi:hypothetical protein
VAGRCLPWGATPRRTDDGGYALDDTVRLQGPVGVAADITDRVNAESGRLSPHAVEVHADDRLRARIALERFSFEKSGEVDHLYHAGVLRARGATLFQIWNTGESPFDTTWVDGGALPQDSSRVHRARVSAEDAAGNATDVEFVFTCGSSAPRPNEELRARRDLAVELGGSFFQAGFAAFPRWPAGADIDTTASAPLLIDARHLGRAVRPLAAYADDDSAELWVAGVARGEDRELRFPAHGLTVRVPGAALRTDAVLYARGDDRAGRTIEGLTRLGRPVRLGPVGWVLHEAITVHIDFAKPRNNQAIFRYDDYRRTWSYLPSVPDSTGFGASTDRPGVFAVFRDDTPPKLGKPVLSATRSFSTGRERREIQVPVTETGSGFDEPRTRVLVGGVRHLFRWDFVAKKLVVPLHDDSIIGRQSVRVIAYDRIGNRSVRSATIDTGAP